MTAPELNVTQAMRIVRSQSLSGTKDQLVELLARAGQVLADECERRRDADMAPRRKPARKGQKHGATRTN